MIRLVPPLKLSNPPPAPPGLAVAPTTPKATPLVATLFPITPAPAGEPVWAYTRPPEPVVALLMACTALPVVPAVSATTPVALSEPLARPITPTPAGLLVSPRTPKTVPVMHPFRTGHDHKL